eukprot:351371-Pelagomonas_calceolata.AAC.2
MLEHSAHPIHFYKVKAHSGIIGNDHCPLMRGLTPAHGLQPSRPPQALHFQMPRTHSTITTGSH